MQSKWCASHNHHVTEGTYSMYFEIPNYTWIIWFYKVVFYQHLCLVVYLYWPRCWVKGVHFRANGLVFSPIVLYRASPRWDKGTELYLVMFGEWCGGHWMGEVLHLYVCPFVCKRMERKLYLYETLMYFNYCVFCANYVILCCLGSICISLSILVKIFWLLTKIPPNQLFIYLYGFKHLVLYNLVVCYSLDPVLVIWHVTSIIFLQIPVYFL